jgi:hypothetical protein
MKKGDNIIVAHLSFTFQMHRIWNEWNGRINGILSLEPFDRWIIIIIITTSPGIYLGIPILFSDASKQVLHTPNYWDNHALKRRHSLAHTRNVVSRARRRSRPTHHLLWSDTTQNRTTASCRSSGKTRLLGSRGSGASRTDVPQIYHCLFLSCLSW